MALVSACGGGLVAPPDGVQDPAAQASAAKAGGQPVAVAEVSPQAGGVPMLAHYFGDGSYDPGGAIVKWEWNFGDGNPGEPAWEDYTATRGEAWHTYEQPGTRVAHLRVTDDDGNRATAKVKLTLRDDLNAAPFAFASVEPPLAQRGAAVTFSAAGSYDADGTLVAYEWDFGDGAGFTDCSASLGEATHAYAAPGEFSARLRITDDDQAQAEATLTVAVNAPPIAVATATPQEAQLGEAVAFSAAGSNDPDGAITVYEWDFGEGAGFSDFSVTSGTAEHSYGSTGEFSATLRVTDDDGAQATAAVTVTVVEPSPPLSEWYMFGRDRQHTRRSAFNGPQAGSLLWSYNTGAVVYSSAALATDGTIYVGSGNWSSGNFSALNPNGTLKWSYPAGGVESSPAVGTDGAVYFGSGMGKLYCLNPDGTLRWAYSTGAIIGSSPVLAEDGTIYFGNRSGNLYALNPDGTLKWQRATGAWVYGSPALGADDTVYIGSRGLQAYAPDGTQLWTYGTWSVHWSSPTIGPDGTIYIGSEDRNFYAVRPNGTLAWSVFGPGSRSSAALAADGTLYVRGFDNYLYSLSSAGVINWKKLTGFLNGDWPSSSPALSADGKIYVGGWDFKVYCFAPNGSIVWQVLTGSVVGGSPCLAPDGTLYVGANNGRLYAFKD